MGYTDKEKRNLKDESLVFALEPYMHRGVLTRRTRLEEEQIWGYRPKSTLWPCEA